ncbi:MAG TPA: patatin-like phospholipase family protein [Bryobacteraceae bacterium]|nr:patatin-like phospholipase family protein [Bryobacteraceae bacterium]
MGKGKTALVLSAGGMFGAYRAGARQAIAERFQPDIAIGASVGALNGWLIASGCPPEQVIEQWRDPAAGAVLKLFPNAGWRRGWFNPEPLRARAERIFSECTSRTVSARGAYREESRFRWRPAGKLPVRAAAGCRKT